MLGALGVQTVKLLVVKVELRGVDPIVLTAITFHWYVVERAKLLVAV